MTTKQKKDIIKLAYKQNKSSVLRWQTMGMTKDTIHTLILQRVEEMIRKTNYELRRAGATKPILSNEIIQVKGLLE